MSLYLALKFIHVLLAIVAVGSNATYGVWIARAGTDPRRLADALGGIAVLDRIANACNGLLLVLASASILGIVLYAPVARRRRQLVAAGDAGSSEYARVTARSTQLGSLTTLIVVAIVFMMVTKPGAT